MDTKTLITARSVMASWEKGGVRPFSMADSVHAEDRTQDILSEASAILSVLSAACSDAKAVGDTGKTSEFDALNPLVLGSALSGIGTLVDLANFLLEE
jgi:hypothetical protein